MPAPPALLVGSSTWILPVERRAEPRALDRGLGTGFGFGTGLAFLCAAGADLGGIAVGCTVGVVGLNTCVVGRFGEGGHDSDSDSGDKARGDGDDVASTVSGGVIGGDTECSAIATGGGTVVVLRTMLFVTNADEPPCLRAAHFACIFARSELVSSEVAVMALAACFPKTCL